MPKFHPFLLFIMTMLN